MNPNPQARTQARDLYFETDLTQAQIANIIGINPKTLYTWIKKENWDRIKTAAVRTPAAIAEKIYIQISELNDAILNREPGNRFATKDEAYILKTLTSSLHKIRKQVTMGETIDIMMGFTNFIRRHDLDLAKKVVAIADQFMGTTKDQYKPFEPEYDLKEEMLRPQPFEEEPPLPEGPAQPEVATQPVPGSLPDVPAPHPRVITLVPPSPSTHQQPQTAATNTPPPVTLNMADVPPPPADPPPPPRIEYDIRW